ncbi:MAG: hypothetical protein WCL14_13825 [Bacteroidota bacterium]
MKEETPNKIIQFIGILFFGFLFYLSIVFYKERMLSFDPAYFSFQILDFRRFFIALGRWGSIFSEIIPFIAFKTHCSLPTFLKIYSASFILNYYLIFLFITVILKNYRAGIVFMLSLCLGFRLVFYYPTQELYIGIALSVLLWAIIAPQNPYLSKLKRQLATITSLPLIFTISYCHQLAFFTIMFALAFELIYQKRWKDIHIWIPIAFTFIWFFIRIEFLTTSEYEQEKLITFNLLTDGMRHFFHLSGWTYFHNFFLHSLKTLCAVIFLVMLIMVLLKRWLLLSFSMLFMLGFLVLIVIIYAGGSNPLFYENYYPPFGFFAAVMLMYLIFERFPQSLTITIISVLLLLNLKGIYNAHALQTERVNYLDRLTAYGRKLPQKKYLLNLKNIPIDVVTIQGFIPFETMLYSSLQNPDSAVTFYWANDINQYDSLLNRENGFLGPDFCVTWFTTNNMNRKYYHLPKTNYMKVNTPQTAPDFQESIFNNKNVTLQALKSEIHSSTYNFVVAPIKITNTSGKTIYSTPDGPHPIFITYHIYDTSGRILYWNNARSILEVDINTEYTQGLMVYLPPKKGTYIIEADIVTEGLRFWNINSRFKLVYD